MHYYQMLGDQISATKLLRPIVVDPRILKSNLLKNFKNLQNFLIKFIKLYKTFYAFKNCFIESLVKFRAKLTLLNLNLQMIVS